MVALIQKYFRIADLDALAVADIFNSIFFRAAIAFHAQNVKANPHPHIVLVGVSCGKIPQYAALDLVAFCIDGDGFMHIQRAILIHRHIADKVADNLLCGHRQSGAEEYNERDE